MKHNFERFNIGSHLIERLQEHKIEKPTEIQERIIPSVMRGIDVIGRSQTGTGKTLAFVLPILEKLDSSVQQTQAVIAAPTRELAVQLMEVFQAYADDQVQMQLIVGGTDRQRMMDKVGNRPHLIIGTPGRIRDMVQASALETASIQTFVVDEADQMLDLGFLEEVNEIASSLKGDVQLLVFSATIPESLMPFLKKYMKQPKQVEVQPDQTAPEAMQHWLVYDKNRDRREVLLKVTERLNPFLAIIFVNTKEFAEEVYQDLLDRGYNVDQLHGDVAPRKRKKVLKKLQDAEVQYLVATDLIARGIDITGVSHIINAEIPSELEYYVHRVGRTARAGWDGTALTIYGRSDEASIAKLKKQGIPFIYKEFRRGGWQTVEKRADQKPTDKGTIMPPKKKTTKVKPGYKKKARAEAERKQQRDRRLERRRTKSKGGRK
ncbi:DEAD/DEAH box helicase [Alkalicoccus chagannorensis]|uniref:DEAD/DEAH box helicase n=1 Tax=Alkalicoccus chagannorensis TaxID=427072 RepID=UPI000419F441|nr:DEAD/DEAH box helicase [Alkalicoccus chagannorensis]